MDHAFTISVPYLQTERLALREYRLADFDAFADHLANPESAAHLVLADRDTAWRVFSSHAGLWALHGAGWWALELLETGELVGNVGAFYRENSAVMEVGWNTYRAFWGRGFASEAAASVVDYALQVRREPRIQALITSGNHSSIRVAQRLGLIYEADTEIHGKVIGRFVRERMP